MVRSSQREKLCLPVLLFHPWEEGFEAQFEKHLDYLRKNGYESIDPETLIDNLNGRTVVLPPRPILLTFDDGSVEIYRMVYPMLKEFRFQGIAFVITRSDLRSDVDNSWWKETDRSGWLRIESHSHSHGLIFESERIVDFYQGEEWKDSFLIKGKDKRPGAPIYSHGCELVHQRYYPERAISDLCAKHVADHGGQGFFKRKSWRKELRQIVARYRRSQSPGGLYEKLHGWRTRMGIEVSRSKKLIEGAVGSGKEVKYFAYPWGTYTDELILLLKRAGYKGAFTTDPGPNRSGDDPFKIKRDTITSEMVNRDFDKLLGKFS